MAGLIEAMELLVAPAQGDAAAVYGRAAPLYERFRELWLSLAGRECEARMVDTLASILRPGQRVLDAGCGTGAMSRRMRDIEPGIELTMLDLTPEMIARAVDVPGRKIVGDIRALPFEDDSFDVAVSAWCIETVPEPELAIDELLRVIAPDGFVLYTFCSLPDGFVSKAGTAALRWAVRHSFAGQFLDAEHAPTHDCDRSRILRFRGGLTTFALLRKCCHVTPEGVPRASDMNRVPPTMGF